MGWQGGSRHLNITSEQDAMTGGVRTDLISYFGVDLYFSNNYLSKNLVVFLFSWIYKQEGL